MDIHKGRAIGPLELTTAGTLPEHAARLADIQEATGAIKAPIFITNVTPTSTGNVGEKEYVPNTVPANSVITDATSDTQNVRVHFIAEATASFYSPSVTYEGNPVTSLTEVPNDRRLFQGYQDVVMTESGEVTLTSSSGATATVQINLAIGGPAVQSYELGANPGSQTELKQGDVISVSGVVPNTATVVTVSDAGVASSGSITLGALNSASQGFRNFTGTITVSNRSGVHTSTIVARNALGTNGNPFISSNSKTLNQTVPTIAAPTFTYPAGQQAIKNSQSMTATSSITNADTVQYTFTRGTVDNDTTIATAKTLNCTAANVYETGVNNYTITATKTSNGATVTRNAQVVVASAAAQISVNITGNPARLRGSAAGNNYTVNITSNQAVHTTQPPVLEAAEGTWIGSWTLSGNTWSRTLQIQDADAPGSYSFSGLSMLNKALVETNTITAGANYTIGGFVIRTITFPAFAQFAPIGAVVTNNAKVRAQYAGTGSDLALRTDTNSAQNSFTIVDASGNYAATGGTHLFISDQAFANSNTSGTLQLTIEELV